MKTRLLLPLVTSLLAGSAAALTVAGTVDGGVPPNTRLGAWVVTPFGQPVEEVVGVPVRAERFSLDLPTTAPGGKALAPLTPQNVTWPGVIDPVAVTGQAQVAELKFFTYVDTNNNGRRDSNEAMREVSPTAGRATLFVVWVSGDVTVKANKGYVAGLKSGWNALLVDVGRAVNVQPYRADISLTVRMTK